MPSKRTTTKPRREPAQDRVCAVCGANAGREGALPFGWRIADVRPFVRTCSEACRDTAKWREYEDAKIALKEAGLTPEEYQRAVAKAAEELGV